MANTQNEGSGGKIMVQLPGQAGAMAMNTWQLYNCLSSMSMQQHNQQAFGQPMPNALKIPTKGGMSVVQGDLSGLVPQGMQVASLRQPQPAENATSTLQSPTAVNGNGSTAQLTEPSNGVSAQTVAQPQDGYKWRKYGQKCLKKSSDGAVEILKSYYRCNFQGCPMRKQVERFAATDQVRVVHFIGSFHNHPPSNDNPLRTTQWASDDFETRQGAAVAAIAAASAAEPQAAAANGEAKACDGASH